MTVENNDATLSKGGTVGRSVATTATGASAQPRGGTGGTGGAIGSGGTGGRSIATTATSATTQPQGGTSTSSGTETGTSILGTGGTNSPIDCSLVTSSRPGTLLESLSATGAGVCADTTVEQFLAKLRTLTGETKSLPLYTNATEGDGNFAFVYLAPTGRLRAVIKTGTGDCPAGCLNNWFTYYEADSTCQPVQVGQYASVWTANCYTVTGVPLWNQPSLKEPTSVCGENLAAQNVSGTFKVAARGKSTPCVYPPVTSPVELASVLTVTIQQDASNLAVGTVILQGTGEPNIDGVSLPATITQRIVSASDSSNSSTNSCPKTNAITFKYDLGTDLHGSLLHTQVDGLDCSDPGTYCKGELSLALSGPQ